MKFNCFSAVLVASLLLFLSALGCGGGAVVKIINPPPLKESKKVVVVPFVSTKADKDVSALGTQLSYNLATRLSLIVKEAEWVYNQSENLNPVSKELKNLNLTAAELAKSPELAAKLGKAMNADLVVIGEVRKPNIKTSTDSKPLKPEIHRAGIAGTSRYIRTLQKATVYVVVRVIDVKTEKPLFSDQVEGYIKYWYAYQTQQRSQVVFKDKQQIYADLNNHILARIIHELHPMGTANIPIPQVLLKPTIPLVGTQGEVKFD